MVRINVTLRTTGKIARFKAHVKHLWETGYFDKTIEERLNALRNFDPADIAFEDTLLKWYDKAYLVCDRAGIVDFYHRLAKQPETLDTPPCDRSIICNEARGCGRRYCPARMVAIETYCRRLKAI